MSTRIKWSLALIAVLGLCVPQLVHAAAGVPDTFTASKSTALSVPAPGVLGNDDCESCAVLTVNDLVVNGHITFGGPADGDNSQPSVASGATLTVYDDGSFIYDPSTLLDPVNTTVDGFTYRATDSRGFSDKTTVTINLVDGPIASPPVANDDQYSVELGSVLTVAAPGILDNDTDADGDPLTIKLINGSQAQFGVSLSLNYGELVLEADGGFTYTPNAGTSAGLDEGFTYTITDGANDSNTANVGISLTQSTTGDTTVMVRFDDVYLVSLDSEVGRTGIDQLELGAASGSLAQVGGAGLPSQTGALILRSSDSATADDAREVLQGCERMGLVAQSQPAKYDLVVQVVSDDPSVSFTVGGDGEVIIDLSQTRIKCWTDRAASPSSP